MKPNIFLEATVITLWKVSVFGYFLLRIQSKCRKNKNQKNSKYGLFSRSEWQICINQSNLAGYQKFNEIDSVVNIAR